MPGDRLTSDDRRRIAGWLADDLTYAEIARRLNRPKSTISREVARNGGAAAYRADRADQLTRQRARRRKPARPAAAPDGHTAYGRDPSAVFAFEQRFVEQSIVTGSPRMVARILVCLYTTDSGSLTAAELVRRLRVSPASVSTAIFWAERQGLVVRSREAGGRQEVYSIDEDGGYRSVLTSVRSNELLSALSKQGAEVLGPDTPAGARLDKLARFLHLISVDLEDSIYRRVREVFGEPSARVSSTGEEQEHELSDIGHSPEHCRFGVRCACGDPVCRPEYSRTLWFDSRFVEAVMFEPQRLQAALH